MHPCITDQHGVADMLGVTHVTVVTWTKTARIPGVHIGNRWRYWTPAVKAVAAGTPVPAHEAEREIISPAELADYLGMTVQGIRAMIRDEKIPARKVGRRLMIDWATLRDAIATGRPLDTLATS